jgi:hypothetical protein
MTPIRDYTVFKTRLQVALQANGRPVERVRAGYANRRSSILRG